MRRPGSEAALRRASQTVRTSHWSSSLRSRIVVQGRAKCELRLRDWGLCSRFPFSYRRLRRHPFRLNTKDRHIASFSFTTSASLIDPLPTRLPRVIQRPLFDSRNHGSRRGGRRLRAASKGGRRRGSLPSLSLWSGRGTSIPSLPLHWVDPVRHPFSSSLASLANSSHADSFTRSAWYGLFSLPQLLLTPGQQKEWLAVSKKARCELCSTPLLFTKSESYFATPRQWEAS